MLKNKKKTGRNTILRKKILELLVNSKSHPTAEWVYSKLKKKFKSISLSTVYSNLRNLKEEGLIWELDFGTGYSHFDAIMHSHYHFVCNHCQNIYDLRISPLKDLDERISQITGFRILSHSLKFFGLCEVCKVKKQEPA